MIYRKFSAVLLAFFALRSPGWSDTVTTTDHLSLNGSVKKMSDGIITLEARFNSGTRTIAVKIAAVDTIEFNATTFNPGAPPNVLGIGPPREGNSAAPETTAKDTIVLRGNERRDCQLVSIDADSVYCKGEHTPYSRRVVLRIVVGSK
jgi:hypothetical protein